MAESPNDIITVYMQRTHKQIQRVSDFRDFFREISACDIDMV